MVCKNCGKKFEKRFEFCPECGVWLKQFDDSSEQADKPRYTERDLQNAEKRGARNEARHECLSKLIGVVIIGIIGGIISMNAGGGFWLGFIAANIIASVLTLGML